MRIESVSEEEDKSFILNKLLSHFFLVNRDLKDPLVGDSQHLDLIQDLNHC